MKKFTLLSALLLAINIALLGQQYWSKRYDFNQGNDYGEQILLVDDGFIVHVLSGCTWDHSDFCYNLTKFSFDGELKWHTTMHEEGPNAALSMAIRNDTIFVNTDYKTKDGYSILMYDLYGNYLNRFDYTHSGEPGSLWARELQAKKNLIYASFVYKDTLSSLRVEKIRVYNTAWNLKWEIKLPDTSAYPKIVTVGFDACNDGGLVGACVSRNSDYETICKINKYDSNGKKQWETLLNGVYDLFSLPISIHEHPDGGYFGHWTLQTNDLFTTTHPDCWFKLNANGEIQWQKLVNLYDDQNFNATFITKNGDMIGCGYGQHSEFDTTAIKDRWYAYIARVKPDGDLRWERRIFELKAGGFLPWLQHGAELADGNLIFTGYIWDTIQTAQNPSWDDLWLLKIDSNGCLTPGCDEKQYVLPVHDLSGQENIEALVAFPNPCSDQFTIAGILGKALPSGDYRYALYDALGNLVKTEVFNPILFHEVDTRGLSPGSYSLVIFLNGRRVQVLKISRVGY